MANYQEGRVKLTNTQLNKIKSAAKNNTRTTLRTNKQNFQNEELPHELFLTTRQTTKIRNAFANNLWTDINVRYMLGNFGIKVITHFVIPLARDNLPGLVSNSASNAINKFERKLSGK